MCVVAIVGNGPVDQLPDLSLYAGDVDRWIGADGGALAVLEQGIGLDFAVGDFDSVTAAEKSIIAEAAGEMDTYAAEKDATDLEIALEKAFSLGAREIYLFGVTGGRLDHAFINAQLLYQIVQRGVRGVIIDKANKLELKLPGSYELCADQHFTYVSFVPFSACVEGVSLTGFRYLVSDFTISWGETRLISNELAEAVASVAFKSGLLLVIFSRD